MRMILNNILKSFRDEEVDFVSKMGTREQAFGRGGSQCGQEEAGRFNV